MDKKTKNKVLIGSGVAVLIIAILLGSYLIFQSPYWQQEVPVEDNLSRFEIISYVDGEDVSSFVEISIWVPNEDHDDEGFDIEEDKYDLTNFDEEVSSQDADDVEIDLTGFYSPIWVEIDVDAETVFENHFYKISGGVNANYSMYAFHRPSDVNPSVVNRTDGAHWRGYNSGNYSIDLRVPWDSTNGLHVGGNWDVSTSDYADMSAREALRMRDQAEWRTWAPTYNPALDTECEFDDDLNKITNAPAIRFLFNDTVNVTATSLDYVDLNIIRRAGSLPDIEVVVSGDGIYCIFYEPIVFINGVDYMYSFDFDITMGLNITCTDVDTGTLLVPEGDIPLGAFTALSAAEDL